MQGKVVVVTGSSAGVGRATAVEFAKHGWRVALLARGTDGLEGARREVEEAGGQAMVVPVDVADQAQVEAKMAKLEANLAKANPLLQSGFPRDIAYGALYLASDDSRFVTGHDLVIDGGMTAGGRTNFEDMRKGSAT